MLRDEYNSLRNEIVSRIEIINSQISTVTTMIFTAWGACIALITISYGSNCQKIASLTILSLLQEFFVLTPIFLLIPMSIKSGENLRQITILSCYICVFHEGRIKESKGLWWETANTSFSNISLDRGIKSGMMKFYNCEYTALALVSLILYVLVTMLSLVRVWSSLHEAMKFLIFSTDVCLFFLALWAVFFIHFSSSIKHNIMDLRKEYYENFISFGERKGLFDKKEADEKRMQVERLCAGGF